MIAPRLSLPKEAMFDDAVRLPTGSELPDKAAFGRDSRGEESPNSEGQGGS